MLLIKLSVSGSGCSYGYGCTVCKMVFNAYNFFKKMSEEK
jgi:hypothetical protein